MKNIILFFQNYSDKILLQKIFLRLYSLPKNQWIYTEHYFNRWQFPPDFYDLIPKWWSDKNTKRDRMHKIVNPIIEIIENEFGRKEVLRIHNTFYGKMSAGQFEYWYSNQDSLSVIDNSSYYDKLNKMRNLSWWDDFVFEKLSKSGVFDEQTIK